MATGHLKIGGSSIGLTMLCPDSINAKAALPERESSEHAERGTRIHSWWEKYMTGDLKPVGKKVSKQDIVEAQIAALAGLKTKEVIADLGMSLENFKFEEMLTFAPDLPQAGGTPDAAGYKPFYDMAVIDLKCGSGQIQAEENHQLIFYACAVLNNMDPFERETLVNCHLIIIQPDTEEPYEVAVRKWTVAVADLPAYEALYRAAILKVAQNTERVPGEHCRDKWCDARAVCPAYLNYVDQQSAGIFGKALEGVKEDPRGQRLSQLLKAKSLISDLLKQADQTAIDILKVDPDGVPDFHLEDGLGNRKWTDEKAAEKALKAIGIKPKTVIVSPAEAEKQAKAMKLEGFELPETKRETTGPRLVKGERTNVFEPLSLPDVTDPKPHVPVMAGAEPIHT